MEKNRRTPTGIKDIHGIEICVDDIVRSYTGPILLNYAGNELVVFYDGKFCLDNEDGTSSLYNIRKPLEIIGNIHDNSKLFKEGGRISFWDD